MLGECSTRIPLPDKNDTELTITQTIRGTLRVPYIQIEVCAGSGGPVSLHDVGLIPITVGTRATCDVVVRDPHVSSEHCEIHVTEQGVVFRDRGSKNGSWIGTTRVVECTLTDNAKVRIGTTTITIRYRGPRELPLCPNESFDEVKGSSLLMRSLFAQLEQVSRERMPIILVGESGTGRSLIAQAISKRMGGRTKFVAIDCAKLRRGQEAKTLFGRSDAENGWNAAARGGMLEKARGGIIFLGNFDALPADVASALVNVLRTQCSLPVADAQQRPFDARVIVSVKPGQRDAHGLGDYARANGAAELAVPPLRHRRDDIPMLVKTFSGQCDPPKTMLDLPAAAHAFFRAYSWPGNVAELRTFVGLFLSIETVKRYLADFTGDNTQKPNLHGLLHMKLADARQVVIDHFDRAYLKAKLEQYGGNVTRTAEAIGVTRPYLSQLKRDHGLGQDDET